MIAGAIVVEQVKKGRIEKQEKKAELAGTKGILNTFYQVRSFPAAEDGS